MVLVEVVTSSSNLVSTLIVQLSFKNVKNPIGWTQIIIGSSGPHVRESVFW